MNLCDFCTGSVPAFVYVIPMGFMPSIGGATQLDDGCWNACHECAELVDARHPGRLAAHVVGRMEADALNPMVLTAEGAAELRAILAAQYVALFGANPSKESL
ncbi:hypothetical protein [Streptomyces scabiei]|uniref:hypothetical protein n=1 Tax=Streptomyces scabiei TaxID=1930 RepID=UPI0029A15642|nr:hypothetical protein [Streptomyces scabiei]MDX3206088.1 hypothetical protein [Streptomyces scabiei]